MKENVYLPDWSSTERLVYTNQLFNIISRLTPEGVEGSVSTLPGSFKAFEADCRAAGIKVPIFPGIMPLNAYGGFKRMTGFCKTRIPPAMAERMATCNGDSDEQKKAFQDFGTAYLTELCQQLVESKLVPGLHFYCLNQALRSFAILKNLGYLQEPPKAE